MGLCEGFGAYLYSRRLTPCGRGLMAPPGLTALGAKGSACDRLRLTGGLRAPPSGGMKYRSAGEVGALSGAIFLCRLWRRKPYNRAFARRKTGQPRCARKVDALRARVEAAAGPDGPGLPRFCRGSASPYWRAPGSRPRKVYNIVEVLHRTSKSAKVGP